MDKIIKKVTLVLRENESQKGTDCKKCIFGDGGNCPMGVKGLDCGEYENAYYTLEDEVKMDNAKIIHFNKDGTYLTLDEERSGVRLYMHLKGIEFIPVWFASFKDCAKTTRDFINSMEAKNG